MIDKALTQLTKLASQVKLAPEERAGIRAVLAQEVSHTPAHPARAIKHFLFNIEYSRIAVGAAASAMLFVGGSISFAAENSLPGDALYSVKTNFNESIVGFIAISDASKAKVNTQFAEKRLNEATTLASQKRLDSKKKKVISDKLKKHVAEVETNIENIVAKNDYATAVDVSTELETTLKAHTDVLIALSNENNTDATAIAMVSDDPAQQAIHESDAESASQTAEFALETENAAFAATALREDAEDAVSLTAFVSSEQLAKEKREEASEAIVSAEKVVASSSSTFDEEFMVMASTSIADSKTAFAEGDVLFATSSFEEAYVHFNTAYRLSLELEQKINTLITLPIGSVIKLPSEGTSTTTPAGGPVTPMESEIISSTTLETTSTTTNVDAKSSVNVTDPVPGSVRTTSNSFLKIR